jgi:hypothetical protein
VGFQVRDERSSKDRGADGEITEHTEELWEEGTLYQDAKEDWMVRSL